MLRSILVFLDTRSWFGSLDKDNDGFTAVIEAVEYIISHFREPLEAKDGDMSNIHDEVEEVVQYTRKIFSIADDYHKIWYNCMSCQTQLNGLMYCCYATYYLVNLFPMAVSKVYFLQQM